MPGTSLALALGACSALQHHRQTIVTGIEARSSAIGDDALFRK
jgi:hypothetical protein